MKHAVQQAVHRITDAVEIRIRAERRLGELIKQQKDTVGLAKGGGDGSNQHKRATGTKKEPVAPTLKEAGIDKKLSSRGQKLAAVPTHAVTTGWQAHGRTHESPTMPDVGRQRFAERTGHRRGSTAPNVTSGRRQAEFARSAGHTRRRGARVGKIAGAVGAADRPSPDAQIRDFT
jgi:hypothetical protein